MIFTQFVNSKKSNVGSQYPKVWMKRNIIIRYDYLYKFFKNEKTLDIIRSLKLKFQYIVQGQRKVSLNFFPQFSKERNFDSVISTREFTCKL